MEERQTYPQAQGRSLLGLSCACVVCASHTCAALAVNSLGSCSQLHMGCMAAPAMGTAWEPSLLVFMSLSH